MWQRNEITGYQIGTFPGAEVYLCPECAEAYVEEQSEGQSKLEDWVRYHVAFPIRSEDIWDKPLKCKRCGKAIKVVLNREGRELFIMQCPTLEEAIAQYGGVGAYWFHDAMKDPALKQLAREIEEERRKLAREEISDIRKAIKSLRVAKSMLLKADNVWDKIETEVAYISDYWSIIEEDPHFKFRLREEIDKVSGALKELINAVKKRANTADLKEKTEAFENALSDFVKKAYIEVYDTEKIRLLTRVIDDNLYGIWFKLLLQSLQDLDEKNSLPNSVPPSNLKR